MRWPWSKKHKHRYKLLGLYSAYYKHGWYTFECRDCGDICGQSYYTFWRGSD